MAQNMFGEPGQYLLIRDPYLDSGSDCVTASSEYAPKVGISVVSEGNQGSLLPAVLGAPSPDDDTGTDLTFRIVRGGAIGSGEFAYRATLESPFRGYGGEFYQWGHHNPGTALAVGGIVLYSRAYRRVVHVSPVVGTPGVGAFHVRHVDANERPQGFWSSSTVASAELVITVCAGGVNVNNHALAGCELRDGSLLVGVRRSILDDGATNVTSQGDWDLYRSVDGGSSWRLAAERVHETFANDSVVLADEATSRMAASGDWIRWVFPTSTTYVTLVSSDGGATWAAAEELSTVDDDGFDPSDFPPEVPILLTDSTFDRQPFDIVGVDDATGTFLMAARGGEDVEFPGEGPRVALWIATRDGPWAYGKNMPGEYDADAAITNPVDEDTAGTQPCGFAFVRDPHWLSLWVWHRTGDYGAAITDAGWNVYRAKLGETLLPWAWERYELDALERQGAWRGVPFNVHGVWCGDRGALLYSRMDGEVQPQVALTGGLTPTLMWIGGWTSHPVGNEIVLADNRAEIVQWTWPEGEPAGGATASASTLWTRTLTGGGAVAYTSDSDALRAASSAAGDQASYKVTMSPNATETPPQWDCTPAQHDLYVQNKQSVTEWAMACGNTQAAPNGRTLVKIGMPSRVAASGHGWRLSIDHRANQVLVKDDVGSTVLATLNEPGMDLSTGDDDRFHRLRLTISPSSTSGVPTGCLYYRDDRGDDWLSTDPFNLPAAAAAAVTLLEWQFGEFPGSAGGAQSSWWRELRSFAQRFRINYTSFSSPEDLIGARCAIRGRALGAGATSTADAHRLQVAWGGSGGVEEDEFTHELDHEGAAEQTLLDSPQLRWLSTAGATWGTQVVYDANAAASGDDPDIGRRFVHNAVALFGIENPTVLVDYADDAAFTTNVVVAGTASAVAFAALRVSARSGAHVTASMVTGVRKGELSGKYLQITAAAGGTGVGHIHKILRHVYDGAAHHLFLDETGQFDVADIQVGSTVSAVSDRVWLPYGQTISRRYMRLRFGVSGENNWRGQWVLGTPVPGIAIEFGRPGEPVLDWSHNDEERPNVTTYRSRRGISWARKEGEADRTISGRMAGDVTGFRYELRDMIKHLGEYQVQPMAILLNDEATAGQDESLALVRFDGPTSLDNQAWAREGGAAQGALRRLGDMQLSWKVIP